MENSVLFRIEADKLARISMSDIAAVKPPYVHFSRQYHEYIFYYILEGELYLREGEVDYHLEPDDFILLDPARRHVGLRTSACRFLYVHFMQNCVETKEIVSDEKELLLPKYHHMERAQRVIRSRELAKILVEHFHGHESYDNLQAACLFQEMLLVGAADYADSLHNRNVSVHGKVREVIPQLIDYLNTSYAEDISGETLSERYHYHFDYLNRQFAKWTGKTIFTYLNTIRVERAKQLLMTGFYSTKEIAEQTGFRDVYYFSRVFKRYTGMTPGQVKRR